MAEEETMTNPTEEVVVEESIDENNQPINTKKQKKKRPRKKKKRSFLRSFSPFEITMIILGILVAIVLVTGFYYLYQSALKSRKAIPKSGIVASDEDKSWLTRVVNSNTPLSQDFAVATSVVTGSPSIQVDSRATKDTVELLDDLKSAIADSGEDVNILAGYSSVPAYMSVYNARISDLVNNNDYTYEEAVAAVNQTMRVPGTDEHSTGLLINFGLGGSLDAAAFQASQSYDWLKNNAWKYGYIERYPEGKDAQTLHAYDPTAFRYVGKEIAEEIYQDQLSLEEYNTVAAQRKADEEAAAAAEKEAQAQAQAEAEAQEAQQ